MTASHDASWGAGHTRPDGPRLTAREVEGIIQRGLPIASQVDVKVTEIGPGTAEIRVPYRPWMLRPGGSVAGPVLMMAADTAMYATILAETAGQEMALTADLNVHFLARVVPGDIRAAARLLKLGRRIAVVEVEIHGANDALAAHVTGSYMLPASPPV